ncbi:hypothetical protein I6I09_09665 [Corynebacterium bovis]|uniref:hypothetical protein n=1 Tax=Corynebacterium bovis TaxID=36808 RepID=UPI0018E1AD2E|nr:hypothetical protein [Corynebacterium bovis]QQC47283.1 hypothetical protein I6I09_09665 [Corynebacterium bovis]
MSAEQGVLEGAVGSLAGAATALGVGGPQARRLMDAAAFTRGFDPAAVTAGIPSRRPSVGTLLTGLSEISSVVSALIDVAGTVPSGALSGASEERSEQDRRAADAERSVCSCASAMGTVQSGAVAAVESVVAGAVALCGGLGGAGVLAPPVLEAAREVIRTALSVVSGILTGRNELLLQCMGVLEKTVAPAAVPGRCDVPSASRRLRLRCRRSRRARGCRPCRRARGCRPCRRARGCRLRRLRRSPRRGRFRRRRHRRRLLRPARLSRRRRFLRRRARRLRRRRRLR